MTDKPALNLVLVTAGTRLLTKAGQQVEVLENPQDGMWLICRHVRADAPAGAPADGDIEPIFAQDISGLA